MASSSDPIVGIVTQGDSPLLSRALTINVGGAETAVQQNQLDSITYRVFDYQTGELTEESPAAPISLDKADVIDDTPPTTGLLAGMNFSWQIDGATYLANGNRRRIVQVTFTLTGGGGFTRAWVLWTENLMG